MGKIAGLLALGLLFPLASALTKEEAEKLRRDDVVKYTGTNKEYTNSFLKATFQGKMIPKRCRNQWRVKLDYADTGGPILLVDPSCPDHQVELDLEDKVDMPKFYQVMCTNYF